MSFLASLFPNKWLSWTSSSHTSNPNPTLSTNIEPFPSPVVSVSPPLFFQQIMKGMATIESVHGKESEQKIYNLPFIAPHCRLYLLWVEEKKIDFQGVVDDQFENKEFPAFDSERATFLNKLQKEAACVCISKDKTWSFQMPSLEEGLFQNLKNIKEVRYVGGGVKGAAGLKYFKELFGVKKGFPEEQLVNLVAKDSFDKLSHDIDLRVIPQTKISKKVVYKQEHTEEERILFNKYFELVRSIGYQLHNSLRLYNKSGNQIKDGLFLKRKLVNELPSESQMSVQKAFPNCMALYSFRVKLIPTQNKEEFADFDNIDLAIGGLRKKLFNLDGIQIILFSSNQSQAAVPRLDVVGKKKMSAIAQLLLRLLYVEKPKEVNEWGIISYFVRLSSGYWALQTDVEAIFVEVIAQLSVANILNHFRNSLSDHCKKSDEIALALRYTVCEALFTHGKVEKANEIWHSEFVPENSLFCTAVAELMKSSLSFSVVKSVFELLGLLDFFFPEAKVFGDNPAQISLRRNTLLLEKNINGGVFPLNLSLERPLESIHQAFTLLSLEERKIINDFYAKTTPPYGLFSKYAKSDEKKNPPIQECFLEGIGLEKNECKLHVSTLVSLAPLIAFDLVLAYGSVVPISFFSFIDSSIKLGQWGYLKERLKIRYPALPAAFFNLHATNEAIELSMWCTISDALQDSSHLLRQDETFCHDLLEQGQKLILDNSSNLSKLEQLLKGMKILAEISCLINSAEGVKASLLVKIRSMQAHATLQQLQKQAEENHRDALNCWEKALQVGSQFEDVWNDEMVSYFIKISSVIESSEEETKSEIIEIPDNILDSLQKFYKNTQEALQFIKKAIPLRILSQKQSACFWLKIYCGCSSSDEKKAVAETLITFLDAIVNPSIANPQFIQDYRWLIKKLQTELGPTGLKDQWHVFKEYLYDTEVIMVDATKREKRRLALAQEELKNAHDLSTAGDAIKKLITFISLPFDNLTECLKQWFALAEKIASKEKADIWSSISYLFLGKEFNTLHEKSEGAFLPFYIKLLSATKEAQKSSLIYSQRDILVQKLLKNEYLFSLDSQQIGECIFILSEYFASQERVEKSLKDDLTRKIPQWMTFCLNYSFPFSLELYAVMTKHQISISFTESELEQLITTATHELTDLALSGAVALHSHISEKYSTLAEKLQNNLLLPFAKRPNYHVNLKKMIGKLKIIKFETLIACGKEFARQETNSSYELLLIIFKEITRIKEFSPDVEDLLIKFSKKKHLPILKNREYLETIFTLCLQYYTHENSDSIFPLILDLCVYSTEKEINLAEIFQQCDETKSISIISWILEQKQNPASLLSILSLFPALPKVTQELIDKCPVPLLEIAYQELKNRVSLKNRQEIHLVFIYQLINFLKTNENFRLKNISDFLKYAQEFSVSNSLCCQKSIKYIFQLYSLYPTSTPGISDLKIAWGILFKKAMRKINSKDDLQVAIDNLKIIDSDNEDDWNTLFISGKKLSAHAELKIAWKIFSGKFPKNESKFPAKEAKCWLTIFDLFSFVPVKEYETWLVNHQKLPLCFTEPELMNSGLFVEGLRALLLANITQMVPDEKQGKNIAKLIEKLANEITSERIQKQKQQFFDYEVILTKLFKILNSSFSESYCNLFSAVGRCFQSSNQTPSDSFHSLVSSIITPSDQKIDFSVRLEEKITASIPAFPWSAKQIFSLFKIILLHQDIKIAVHLFCLLRKRRNDSQKKNSSEWHQISKELDNLLSQTNSHQLRCLFVSLILYDSKRAEKIIAEAFKGTVIGVSKEELEHALDCSAIALNDASISFSEAFKCYRYCIREVLDLTIRFPFSENKMGGFFEKIRALWNCKPLFDIKKFIEFENELKKEAKKNRERLHDSSNSGYIDYENRRQSILCRVILEELTVFIRDDTFLKSCQEKIWLDIVSFCFNQISESEDPFNIIPTHFALNFITSKFLFGFNALGLKLDNRQAFINYCFAGEKRNIIFSKNVKKYSNILQLKQNDYSFQLAFFLMQPLPKDTEISQAKFQSLSLIFDNLFTLKTLSAMQYAHLVIKHGQPTLNTEKQYSRWKILQCEKIIRGIIQYDFSKTEILSLKSVLEIIWDLLKHIIAQENSLNSLGSLFQDIYFWTPAYIDSQIFQSHKQKIYDCFLHASNKNLFSEEENCQLLMTFIDLLSPQQKIEKLQKNPMFEANQMKYILQIYFRFAQITYKKINILNILLINWQSVCSESTQQIIIKMLSDLNAAEEEVNQMCNIEFDSSNFDKSLENVLEKFEILNKTDVNTGNVAEGDIREGIRCLYRMFMRETTFSLGCIFSRLRAKLIEKYSLLISKNVNSNKLKSYQDEQNIFDLTLIIPSQKNISVERKQDYIEKIVDHLLKIPKALAIRYACQVVTQHFEPEVFESESSLVETHFSTSSAQDCEWLTFDFQIRIYTKIIEVLRNLITEEEERLTCLKIMWDLLRNLRGIEWTSKEHRFFENVDKLLYCQIIYDDENLLKLHREKFKDLFRYLIASNLLTTNGLGKFFMMIADQFSQDEIIDKLKHFKTKMNTSENIWNKKVNAWLKESIISFLTIPKKESLKVILGILCNTKDFQTIERSLWTEFQNQVQNLFFQWDSLNEKARIESINLNKELLGKIALKLV